jgi:hypothetical protein
MGCARPSRSDGSSGSRASSKISAVDSASRTSRQSSPDRCATSASIIQVARRLLSLPSRASVMRSV